MTQLARFRHAGEDRLGVIHGDLYIDLTKAYAGAQAATGVANAAALANAVLGPDALAYLQGGEASYAALREAVAYAASLDPDAARAAGVTVARADAKTLVPVPNPPKIVCVARNYGKHAAEAGLQVSEIPILFPRFAVTQIADGDPIVAPSCPSSSTGRASSPS
ncbi:hypothetical protein [Leucobacter soli]|uniref:hypothetical protein n=1 Tax=Leucobacter soli TaxID=2812850 RepID=UPI00361FD636